jgi:hypothetical protein
LPPNPNIGSSPTDPVTRIVSIGDVDDGHCEILQKMSARIDAAMPCAQLTEKKFR